MLCCAVLCLLLAVGSVAIAPADVASGTHTREGNYGAYAYASGNGAKSFTTDWLSGVGVTAHIVGYTHLGTEVQPTWTNYFNCRHTHSGRPPHNHATLYCTRRATKVWSVYEVGVKIGIGPLSTPCLACETYRDYIGLKSVSYSFWWGGRGGPRR